MYFKYSWNANLTALQLAEDFTAIVTGTTDPNSLGLGCRKDNTQLIENIESTGWSLYDNSTPTKPVFFCLDNGGSMYKFVQADIATNSIALKLFESWNADTHVGTNAPYAAGGIVNNAFAINTTNPGSVYIFATSRYLIIALPSGQASIFSAALEFSRDSKTVGPTYPCVFPLSNLSNFNAIPVGAAGLCRIKKPDGAGDNVGATIIGGIINLMTMPTYGGNAYSQNSGPYGYDDLKHLIVYPIIIGYNKINYATILGKACGDILLIPTHTVPYTQLDEISINDKTYVMLVLVGSMTFAVPKV